MKSELLLLEQSPMIPVRTFKSAGQRGRVPSANNSRNVKNFLRSCWVLVDLPAAKHLYNVLKTEDSFGSFT